VERRLLLPLPSLQWMRWPNGDRNNTEMGKRSGEKQDEALSPGDISPTSIAFL